MMPVNPAGVRSGGRWLVLLIIATIAILLITSRQFLPRGDWDEYYLMAHAIAQHGTPDIRLADAETLQQQLDPHFAGTIQKIADNIRIGLATPASGLQKSLAGPIFSIHFFGYSVMAGAIQVLTGLPIEKSFIAVNLIFVLILGNALFSLFKSPWYAILGVIVFVCCGGLAYWRWSSPEVMSAASLLAALIYVHLNAPGIAALLLGIAAMQNPPIALGFVLIPAGYALASRAGIYRHALFDHRPKAGSVLGIVAGVLLTIAPVAFNLWAFGVPSQIAKVATVPALIGAQRLHSFFFDLNQGMLPNLPGLFAVLLVLLWLTRVSKANSGWYWTELLLAIVLALIFTVPALSAGNWNSGAEGMMRYAFWAAMPFLFVCFVALVRLHPRPNWLLALLLAFQGVVIASGQAQLGYLRHSRIAKAIFTMAPSWYNPDPEIFVERLLGTETGLDPSQAYRFEVDGKTRKLLFHLHNLTIDQVLCGDGHRLSERNNITPVRDQWAYLNESAALCVVGEKTHVLFDFKSFLQPEPKVLAEGWSGLENANENWQGAWSNGDQSLINLHLKEATGIKSIVLQGLYYGVNRRTKVQINGVDFGWRLANEQIQTDIVFPKPLDTLSIVLTHESPRDPAKDGFSDTRHIALFLKKIIIRTQ